MPPKAIADWVGEIKALFAQRRTSTLELAKVVYAAKRKLLYGQWTSMWEVRQASKLPFSKRTGYMLAVIGRELGDLDVHNCARLPSAERTLYHLAQLDRTVLVILISNETIHPALTTQEAKDLLALYQPKANRRPRRLQVKRRLAKFRDFVETTLSDWSPEEREAVRLGLFQLAQKIERYRNRATFEDSLRDCGFDPSNHAGQTLAQPVSGSIAAN